MTEDTRPPEDRHTHAIVESVHEHIGYPAHVHRWMTVEDAVTAYGPSTRPPEDRLREAVAILRFHNRTPSGATRKCLDGCIACAFLAEDAALAASRPAPDYLAALSRAATEDVTPDDTDDGDHSAFTHRDDDEEPPYPEAPAEPPVADPTARSMTRWFLMQERGNQADWIRKVAPSLSDLLGWDGSASSAATSSLDAAPIDVEPELRDWADRFALTGVEWLHEVNRHIHHERNAPIPPDNSWLALEGCQHGDCVMGRRFKAALAVRLRESQHGGTISGDCWEWIGSTASTGYGHIWVDTNRWMPAHRAVYEELVGLIPPGQELDHLCRNTMCVNPDHLEPVPPRINRSRSPKPFRPHVMPTGKAHVLGRRQTCKHGHPFSGDNLIYTARGRICRACKTARQHLWKYRHPRKAR